jgi:hypothetical protein
MKLSFLSLTTVAATLTVAAFAADPATPTEEAKPKKPRALIVADADNTASAPATKPKDEGAPAVATPAPTAAVTPPKPADEPTTMLPKVEVNKSRITNLDIEIQEQDRAIAREKALTKPTKLDDTLNNSKVSKALAIFGGSSSDQRSGLAGERVRMMEEEKQLLESLKLAQTKEEKAELQDELNALRATRRELDLAPK